MIGSWDAPCQANGIRSSTVCSLTVNPCGFEGAAKGEKGILGCENVGIAQPADKSTIFDPRSPRDNRGRTMEVFEEIDQGAKNLAGVRSSSAARATRCGVGQEITKQTLSVSSLSSESDQGRAVRVRLKPDPDQFGLNDAEIVRIHRRDLSGSLAHPQLELSQGFDGVMQVVVFKTS